MAAVEEPVRFVGGSGHELAAELGIPDGQVRGGVLLAHCFTCSKDLHTMTRLSRGLLSSGWAVLRFDFTGIGESDGDFADKTVTRNVQDLVEAAAFLTGRVDAPLCLLGHSLGGAAALLAAERIGNVASIAVLCAPSTPVHMRAALSHVVDEVEETGIVNVTIAGRQFPISAGFFADLERHEQRKAVADLGCPLLVVHALDDEVVPVEDGEANFAAARQPKAFMPMLSTDHLISDRRRAEEVVEHVVAWFDRTV